MTAAQRYGEIDADAIRHSMTAYSDTWSDGTHVRVIDEVHVLDESDLVRAYVARHRRQTDEALRILRSVPPVDPSTGLATFATASPAAASEGMGCASPQARALVAGAENEAPGVGIPPPRPVPPDEHFSYIQELTGRIVHPYGERFR